MLLFLFHVIAQLSLLAYMEQYTPSFKKGWPFEVFVFMQLQHHPPFLCKLNSLLRLLGVCLFSSKPVKTKENAHGINKQAI